MSDIKPPNIIVFSGSDWPSYQNKLYEIFCETLLKKSVLFLGLPVKIKRHPEYLEKHFAFWHLISEGEREDERIPDPRRCERISWISWVIENCHDNEDIYWWKNERWGNKHVVMWYKKENYVVILAERNGYFLLKTAYLVKSNRAKTLKKEMNEFYKKAV